jgi:tripartite-type tricarboxylate transporter receptor subunit TctC
MLDNTLAKIAVAGAFALLGSAALIPARAAESAYPNRQIMIVLPVTPGGGTDMVVRIIGIKLADRLKQTVLIENKPGAGGNIAAEYVARRPPDGYTLLAVTASHATNPSIYKHMSYDPIRDFAPITQLTSQPYLFVVNPSVPAHNVKEFVAWAKSRPNGFTFASSGTGLLGHLGMEMFDGLADIKGVHVPYKGAGPALVDTIGGQVNAFFPTVVSGGPQVKQGTLRAIGVTGRTRLPTFPDVPTVAEQGYPNFEVLGWYGLLAPAGTPKPIVDLLNKSIVEVLHDPEVVAHIKADGAEPVGSTPEEFAALIRSEKERWAKVVQSSGLPAN